MLRLDALPLYGPDMIVAWLYLMFSLSWLYGALNALFPVRNYRLFVVQSWLFGWLVGEAPLHWLVGEALIAYAFIDERALRRTPGKVALAISVLAWLILLYLYRQGHRAKEVTEAALKDAFSPELRATLRTGFEQDIRLPRSRSLAPWWYGHSGVRRVRNIAYGPGRRHRLDLYLPRAELANAPVIFQIHGGFWAFGDKAQQAQPLLYYMAARGFVCVSINYHLSPWQRWPAQLLDAKRALVWVKQEITKYGGDPGFVVCTGGSAGGQLASLLALTANDVSLQEHAPDVDTRVQAAVPFYAVYDFCNSERQHRHGGLRMLLEWMLMGKRFATHEADYRAASPLHRVHADAPPFFVVHGSHDSLACVEEARLFVARLSSVSRAKVVYAELPLAQHAFEVFHSPRSGHVVRATHAFCEATYAEHVARERAAREHA